MNRGELREAELPKSEYFNDAYFDIRQLMAQILQIKHIHTLKPSSIIEIGIGNGLTSTFFKNSGIDVVTADINPNLNPDIIAPMSELTECIGGRQFDLVVCCEVLEHMPLDQLESNIKILRSLGGRLFMTLPGYTQSFGISFVLKMPFLKAKDYFLYLFLPKRIDLKKTQHFWEVGSHPMTKRKEIVKLLKRYYSDVSTGRLSAQPNHIYFVAK